MFQGLAFEKFHGDEGLAVLLVNLVNGADVGVVQCRSGLRFALETCESLLVTGDIFGKEFKRHKTVQLDVLSLVHNAHTAAKFLDDPIMGDGLADERVAIRHLADILGLGPY